MELKIKDKINTMHRREIKQVDLRKRLKNNSLHTS
jgi:hypothetical protein